MVHDTSHESCLLLFLPCIIIICSQKSWAMPCTHSFECTIRNHPITLWHIICVPNCILKIVDTWFYWKGFSIWNFVITFRCWIVPFLFWFCRDISWWLVLSDCGALVFLHWMFSVVSFLTVCRGMRDLELAVDSSSSTED